MSKKQIFQLSTLALVFLVILVSSCNWFANNKIENSKEIESNSKSLKLINVLDASMFAEGHIKGSIHIPFDKIEKEAKRNLKANTWKKDVPIVIYCSNYYCAASREAAKQLKNLGFTDVCAYEGGTAEWYKLSQKDPSYQMEGSFLEKYAELYVEKPELDEQDSNICTISAEQLKKRLA